MTKCVKIACILGILGLGCNSAIADDVQKEIEALKKENELLELKKKNEQLKAGKEVKESSVGSAVVERSGFLGFCKGEYKNTGCFIGAELGIAPSIKNNISIAGTNSYDFGSGETSTIPFSLIFGYQHYFAQNMGINFKGYVGYANYNSDITLGQYTVDYKSQALHYGIELSYLYDFIATPKHTFGLNVGIGYEFGTFLGQGLYKNTDDIENKNTDDIQIDLSLDSYTNTAFISSIGLHYFLNTHHQFLLNFKYRGYSIVDGGNKNKNGGVVKYVTTPNNLISIAYAYKF